MIKALNKFVIILMVMLVTITLCGGKVNAANASIRTSKTTVTEGETFTVTVDFGEEAKSAQMSFSFDTANLEYKGSNGTYNQATKKYAAFSMGGNTLSSATFTFTAKKAASVSFSFGGLEIQNTENRRLTPTVSNSAVSVAIKEKANSNNESGDGNNSGSSNEGNSGNNSGSNNGGNSSSNNGSSSGNNNGGNSGSNSGSSNTTKPSTDKKPTFTNVNQKVYAKETVYIRDTWSSSGKRLGTLQKDSSITRTGIGSNGWDKVNYNGTTAYISHTYLTTTKPKEDKKDDDNKNNTTNEVNNNTVNEVNNTVSNEANNEMDNNQTNDEANNQINDVTNNQANEVTNTQGQGNEKSGNKINVIEIIIIAVIVLAIVVIIVNEVMAKKREEKRRRAKRKAKRETERE